MYSFCPSELNVNLGTNSWNLVNITLQALPPARQIRLLSDSSSIFSSIFVFGRSLSSNDSKKEYLLRGISQLTVAESPNSYFLTEKPLL